MREAKPFFSCRSGAVEQLRVHVRNLGMLGVNGSEGKSSVELFERGYGKDAAGIAKEAITYGIAISIQISMALIEVVIKQKAITSTLYSLTQQDVCRIMR